MYVWQMNDGSWNISLLTSQRDMFSRILALPEASKAYSRSYRSRREAAAAEKMIRNLLETAA
jgi:hypothetical protein